MISAIIPNYNHARYLDQRINSVLSQTYQDFEVIILDDASTDNSREIIETFRGHHKIKEIVYNDVNSGSTFRQWEKGIQFSSGEYIWIAESDDYCSQTFLESAVAYLEKYNTSIHYCQSHLVDENNAILEYTLQWPESITSINWKQPFCMNGKEFIQKGLQYKNVIPNASAVVFLKDKFDFNQLNIYKTAGDWLFWSKILLAADISYSAEILNSFRSHSNTTRNLSTHTKLLRRYLEELAIKCQLIYKYQLGKRFELDTFLKFCIDFCLISDFGFYRNFCKEFKLPDSFLIQFLIRKLIVNKYTRRVFR